MTRNTANWKIFSILEYNCTPENLSKVGALNDISFYMQCKDVLKDTLLAYPELRWIQALCEVNMVDPNQKNRFNEESEETYCKLLDMEYSPDKEGLKQYCKTIEELSKELFQEYETSKI